MDATRISYVFCVFALVGFVFTKVHYYGVEVEDDFALNNEFNHGCVVDYELEGDPVKVELTSAMRQDAVKAARAIKDLEKDTFDIRADCVNTQMEDVNATIRMQYVVLDTSGWSRSKLVDATRAAGEIYGRCGIQFEDVEVTVVDVDRHYTKVQMNEYYQLVSATRRTADPYLYFMNQQDVYERDLWGLAYNDGFTERLVSDREQFVRKTGVESLPEKNAMDNIALIVGNHTERNDRLYAHRTLGLGVTIAHELYHIYGDCTCHERNRQNFMHAGGGRSRNEITPSQCATALKGISRIRGYENQRIMTLDEDS